MAWFTVLEYLIGLVFGLVMYIFALVPLYNGFTSAILTSGIVVSNFDMQVITVLYWVTVGSVMFSLIGGAIYAFNNIVYKSGAGI
jgi:cytochrome c oxidase assembly protein Cox11